MAVKIGKDKVRIAIPVGNEDVVLVFNQPTTEAISKFLKSRWPTRRNKTQDKSVEARISFSEEHLFDVENVVYDNEEGKEVSLDNKVNGWIKKLNVTWLISAAMHFEESEQGEADLGNE